MKRRDFCKALALSAAALAVPHAAAAENTQTVGRAVPDGRYSLRFRSELSLTDVPHDYYYSDSFFARSSMEYNHSLALATLGMVGAAFNTAASDAQYWVNGEVGRESNLADAFATLGFADPVFYHYDIDVGQAGDFVGHSLARKTITLSGQRNLHTGVGAGHAGFVIPVAEVLASLKSYLAAAAKQGATGTIKLWVGGYSRGAAVANLLAARINKDLPDIDRKNVFVYTFATPVALTAASYPDYQLDYDNNHNADGTLKTTWAASNIYNILSSGDLVPRVLPAEWGYHRNGNDRFLPSTQNEKELADLDVRGASFSEVPLTISGLATKEDTDGVMERLETFFGSKQQFHDKYEAVLMDMIQCAFLRNEAECTEGYLLTDEEVEARLRGLGNMRNVDEAKLEKSVHNASALSRPLLEKLEQNDGNLTLRGKTYHVEVPPRVKQAVIPVLAVGLYYGIDSGTVAAMARYIFMFMSMKPDSADVVVRAAFCHHCEDYISLMEYYPPADHGMEAYTRA